MNVLIDTSVWSAVLRRGSFKNRTAVNELPELIKEMRVRIMGPIRQELLSGIKSDGQFTDLKSYLSAFPDLPLETGDFERAAEFSNNCRRNGIQGSNTDFLICSVAHRHGLEIYTLDNDFLEYRKYLPLKLYSPRNGL